MEKKIKNYIQDVGLQQSLGLESTFVVCFLAQGECNQNYLIDDGQKRYVFRINYESQLNLPDQIEYEYQALTWLIKSKRTPIPYYVDDSRRHFSQGILIMAFLAGRPLNYQKDLLEASAIFSDIHGLSVSSDLLLKTEYQLLAERVVECRKLLEPVFNSQYLDSKQLQLFDQALDACQQGIRKEKAFEEMNVWRINNTEVNSHNFIIDSNQGWLIDWEKPVISHPCQDLTQFLASTTTLWRTNHRLSYEDKQLFLANYVTRSGFNLTEMEEAMEIYSPYLMLRALAWSAMAYDQYLSGEKALKNEEIVKKISHYLERDFLEAALKEKVLAYD